MTVELEHPDSIYPAEDDGNPTTSRHQRTSFCSTRAAPVVKKYGTYNIPVDVLSILFLPKLRRATIRSCLSARSVVFVKLIVLVLDLISLYFYYFFLAGDR